MTLCIYDLVEFYHKKVYVSMKILAKLNVGGALCSLEFVVVYSA
jgi:hypothetical protein